MPVYDVAAVAEAAGIEPKRLDNIISRNEVPGVDRKHRGVSRRLSSEAVLVIRLAHELARALRVPVAAALNFAAEAARADGRSQHRQIQLGEFATLTVDWAALQASTLARLDAAVEAVGRRPRGRPAGTRREAAYRP